MDHSKVTHWKTNHHMRAQTSKSRPNQRNTTPGKGPSAWTLAKPPKMPIDQIRSARSINQRDQLLTSRCKHLQIRSKMGGPIKDRKAEILNRLPIKSLIRLWCVCKPWCFFFSSPSLIKSHLIRISQNPLNDSLVVHSLSGHFDDIITIFRIDSIESPLTPTIHFPETFFKMELVGSINGLIFLCDRSLGFMIVLWNPATRMCTSIPFPRKERHADKVFVGFGFDDFRVVCIFRFKLTEKKML